MQQAIPGRQWAPLLPVALTAAFVIAFDQVTKHWVRAAFYIGQAMPNDWPVRLRYVENTGSAFGLFPNQTFILVIASIVAMGVVVWMFRQTGISSLPLRLSLGLMLGGGMSNLYDRVHYGTVTDFIDFRVWPIFNVADSSVCIGIAVLVVYILLRESKAPKTG